MEKDWPKSPCDSQLQETRKKTDRAIITAAEAVRVPGTWHRQGPCKPSSCTTFTLNSHWGRAATGQKNLASVCRMASVVSDSLQPCRLWRARLLCQGGGLSRQGHWSVLANTGCHTPLEHYISCCPSHQLP